MRKAPSSFYPRHFYSRACVSPSFFSLLQFWGDSGPSNENGEDNNSGTFYPCFKTNFKTKLNIDEAQNLIYYNSKHCIFILFHRSNKVQTQEIGGQEPILPAVLEFPETQQETFLTQVISELDVNVPNFKLAPVYTLYLCAR